MKQGTRRSGADGAVLRLNSRLRLAYAGFGSDNSRPLRMRIRTEGFKASDSAPQSDDGVPGVYLSIASDNVSVLNKRTMCTFGGGICRRYEGLFNMTWQDRKSERSLPAAGAPLRFVIEDSCPNTRGAMVEAYASRSGIFEFLHELINK